jgi:ferric-dicitrate binding protein FerR (iron transport regulator)
MDDWGDWDEHGAGGRVRGAFEALLDSSREPALPGVTDAAVAGGRRIRRRRTAVSGAVGALVAAVLTAGIVAAARHRPEARNADATGTRTAV